MAYSAALWNEPANRDTLDAAQTRKLDWHLEMSGAASTRRLGFERETGELLVEPDRDRKVDRVSRQQRDREPAQSDLREPPDAGDAADQRRPDRGDRLGAHRVERQLDPEEFESPRRRPAPGGVSLMPTYPSRGKLSSMRTPSGSLMKSWMTRPPGTSRCT